MSRPLHVADPLDLARAQISALLDMVGVAEDQRDAALGVIDAARAFVAEHPALASRRMRVAVQEYDAARGVAAQAAGKADGRV